MISRVSKRPGRPGNRHSAGSGMPGETMRPNSRLCDGTKRAQPDCRDGSPQSPKLAWHLEICLCQGLPCSLVGPRWTTSFRRFCMNKAELIDVLTEQLGSDRRQATAAVEHIVDTIVRAVHKGDSVTITGFGVFEQRRRAARVARNPRTGETVKVKPTSVPAFRPGAQFKAVIAGPEASGRADPRSSAARWARSSLRRRPRRRRPAKKVVGQEGCARVKKAVVKKARRRRRRRRQEGGREEGCRQEGCAR